MLQIILIFIVLGVIFWLGEILLKAAKGIFTILTNVFIFVLGALFAPALLLNHIMTMPMGLALIVQVLLVLGLLGYWQIVVWPLALIITIIYWLYFALKKHTCKKRLANEGIVPISNFFPNKDFQKMFVKSDYVTVWGDYIAYKPFLQQIIKQTDAQGVVDTKELQGYATQAAPGFQTEYTKELVEFLQYDNNLVSFYLAGNGDFYMGKPFMQECQQILEELGGTTAGEFLDECPKLKENEKLSDDSICLELSGRILDYFVKSKIAESIYLQKMGDTFYKAKRCAPNCKMKCVEMSLD